MKDEISFGPDPLLVGLWTLLCSPPALVTGYLFVKAPTQASAIQFAWTLIFPFLPVLFAYRSRATFAPTEFIYRRWGRTIRVPLSDVDRIEVANGTPISGQAVGAFIVTKQGTRLPFWPKLFPREAVNRFFSLAG